MTMDMRAPAESNVEGIPAQCQVCSFDQGGRSLITGKARGQCGNARLIQDPETQFMVNALYMVLAQEGRCPLYRPHPDYPDAYRARDTGEQA